MVNVIEIEHVTKRFALRKVKSIKESMFAVAKGQSNKERFTALHDVNLSVAAGESVGLVGPNGSGKSTLLKLIGGILAPDEGRIRARGRLAALLELGAGFHPDLTGRENIFLNASIMGLTRTETERYFDDIVDFSGIPDRIDTQVKFYSSGQYVRLAFAVAVHVDPDILLVDEVLAVGDEPFQIKCMEKIRQFQREGRTIVLVSHSAGQVAAVCDRAIVLEKGRVVENAPPRIALGRLRQDYGEAIEAAMLRSDQATSEYSAQLVSIELNPGAERPEGDFDLVLNPGEDLIVSGVIDFATATPDWQVSVIVETTMGGLVFGTDTKIMGCDTGVGSGPTPFRLTFPSLQAGLGDYVVNVQVRDRLGLPLDNITRAATFTVSGDGRSVGGLRVDPHLELG